LVSNLGERHGRLPAHPKFRRYPRSEISTDFADLAGATTGGFTLYGLIGNRLSSYLTLLESTSRFKVLSNPTVFTLNNVPATISTGQRIAVPSNTLTTAGTVPGQNASVSATVQYEEVVLEIQVVPLINSEDEVTLQIAQKNDDVGDRTLIGGNLVPNITTQTLTTTVVVPNRSSVLLGGLITERDRKASNGFPILSRVPVARLVFGTTKVERDRTELLISCSRRSWTPRNSLRRLATRCPKMPHWLPPFRPSPMWLIRNRGAFAAGGGKAPMWKRVFGKKTNVLTPSPTAVQPAGVPPARSE